MGEGALAHRLTSGPKMLVTVPARGSTRCQKTTLLLSSKPCPGVPSFEPLYSHLCRSLFSLVPVATGPAGEVRLRPS